MVRSRATKDAQTSGGRYFTYADYSSWPDDGRRYEILDGEVVEVNAPLVPHQEVLFALCRALDDGLTALGAGRSWMAAVDVVLAADTVLQPDAMAVRTERLSIVRAQGIFGAPDLVVEVLSPSTSARDMLEKREAYQRFGVREYWIVDPVGRVLWQLALEDRVLKEAGRFGADAEVESRAFPGMKVKLAGIWARTTE